MFMQRTHKAYSITATVCTACAAVTPGTLVHESMRLTRDDNVIRFGHPSGSIDAEVDTQQGSITRVTVGRTARRIMEGYVFVPNAVYE
jgi:2-methylaconitate cis-trans-isomerase PrpF